MNTRITLVIVATLTAFVLVIAGGLAIRLSQRIAPTPIAVSAPIVTSPVQPDIPIEPTALADAPVIALADASVAQLSTDSQPLLNQGVPAQVPVRMPIPAAALPTAAVPVNGAVSPEERAIQAAVAYYGTGDVVEVKRDTEDDRPVYEVIFSDGSKVYVGATSGQVVYAKIKESHSESDNHERGDD